MHLCKKMIKILFALILMGPVVNAQQTEEDSLKKIALANKLDTGTIDANRMLCFMYFEDKPALAIEYGKVALAKANTLNDSFRIAHASKTMGIAYDSKGNLDSALLFLRKALAIFTELHSDVYVSHTLTDIALAYYYKGNFELALRNHQAALTVRKKLGNNKLIAQSFLNMGLVYRSRKDYKNAIRYYKESYQIKQAIQDSMGMLNSLINIGAAFQSNGQHDSALHYSTSSLKLSQALRSAGDVAASKENIAAALVNLSRTGEAIGYLRAAETDSNIQGNKNRLITHYETFGDLYMQENKPAIAMSYYKKGLELAKSNSRLEAMELFYRKISNCFYAQNDFKNAYDYFELSNRISDTLLNEENIRQINEMNAVYESAEKETKITTLETKNETALNKERQRRTERNYFALATLLFIGLATLSYIAFINNKKKKILLNKQNLIIEKSLAEKEILLKEIHHRVKNNLQIVSSLLNLQANYIKDEQALDAVKEGRNRVESMSLIHQNLYQDEHLTGINIKEYIDNLTKNLMQSYNISPGRVHLHTEVQPLILDVDTVIPIGLILNELITNCLKYAYAREQKGNINILLKETTDELLLSVYDDGKGFPELLNNEGAKSFGHKMIQAFLKKLEGTMNMYNEHGARVDIKVTNYKKTSV